MNKTEQNLKCDFCGRKAIGMQILGCTQQVVCEEHAEKMLVEMGPGEKKSWGDCYYVKFE